MHACNALTDYYLFTKHCIGCGELLVTDGVWKLQYPTCLFKVPMEVKGIKVNMPDCCPNQPLHGKPFCKEHTDRLGAGVPEDLLGLIKHFRPHVNPEKASLLGINVISCMHENAV